MLTENDLTGALLAGGRSTRMGRDKCLLEIDDRPAWRRQLDLLGGVCREVLIVSREHKDWMPESVPWFADIIDGHGPLAGLAAALQNAKTPFVLTLAVDLPNLTLDYLRSLIARSDGVRGIVPVLDDLFQPLTAIYSRSCLPIVRKHLEQPDKSFQSLIRDLIARELMEAMEVSESNRAILRNKNFPDP